MSWLYLFLTTIIGVTECQTLVSYSECPMVDELLLKTFEEKKKLEIEISNLTGHVDHLHRDLAHLEKLFKSILIQSKCRPFTFGLMCKPCRCNKATTEVCDYETGSCKCKPGFQGERCNCVKGKHQCNLTSSYCSSNIFDGSPVCICRDGFRKSSGCKQCSTVVKCANMIPAIKPSSADGMSILCRVLGVVKRCIEPFKDTCKDDENTQMIMQGFSYLKRSCENDALNRMESGI